MSSNTLARSLGALVAVCVMGCGSESKPDDDSKGGSNNGGTESTNGDKPKDAGGELEHFSFFVTSLEAMRKLSKSQSGFGGDLRFGETGPGAGLRGADKICSTIAEMSMPGSSAKEWRAFLSATDDGEGQQVNAIERVGKGPWYDRLGRLLAEDLTDLKNTRPKGAHSAIINDFPNELGVPNHDPDGRGQVDNHDFLTGTNDKGELYGDERSTCKDWTSAVGSDGTPRVGHSWPRSFGDFPGDGGFPGFPGRDGGGFPGFPGGDDGGGFPGFPGGGDFSGEDWMSSLNEAGCAPGVSLIEMGPPNPNDPTVGSGGGYGGIYCFALAP